MTPEQQEETPKPKKRKKQGFKRGYLKNPQLPRPNETIGGGWFVFRRGGDTKRIRPALWPFEYATEQEAQAQATLLAIREKGEQFIVVGQSGSVIVDQSGTANFSRRNAQTTL